MQSSDAQKLQCRLGHCVRNWMTLEFPIRIVVAGQGSNGKVRVDMGFP